MGPAGRLDPFDEASMKPAPFQYHAPKTVDEAVALLTEVAPKDGRILAGGQSLVPTMAFRLARPAHLVDINGVEVLSRLKVRDGKLCLRAARGVPQAGGGRAARQAPICGVQHIAH